MKETGRTERHRERAAHVPSHLDEINDSQPHGTGYDLMASNGRVYIVTAHHFIPFKINCQAKQRGKLPSCGSVVSHPLRHSRRTDVTAAAPDDHLTSRQLHDPTTSPIICPSSLQQRRPTTLSVPHIRRGHRSDGEFFHGVRPTVSYLHAARFKSLSRRVFTLFACASPLPQLRSILEAT
jgi:hypothetical protein